ncbi:MAG: hypothetical protein KBT66_06175 [Amphritea sp.]|nr:hypothetical protein [Amphritea sp.]
MNIKLLTGITLGLAMVTSSAFAANTILEGPYSSHVTSTSEVNSSYGTSNAEMDSASNKAISSNKITTVWGWDTDSSR